MSGTRTPESIAWSKAVRRRAGWSCQSCGDRPRWLHAHHVRPKGLFPTFALDLSNGVALCGPCHKRAHKTLRRGWRALGGQKTLKRLGTLRSINPSVLRRPGSRYTGAR